MKKAQDAGILSGYCFRFSEPDRLIQVAAKAEGGPKAGRKAG